jgi:ATP-dependent DNA helicase RecQ
VEALLASPRHFDVNLTALASTHDVRPLVLKTALTYLELAGALRQGTPFYAGYEARPLVPVEEIVAAFEGERASFAQGLFAKAKRGRTWYGFDPERLAVALSCERSRVVRALEYFESRGWVELRASDARMRFERLGSTDAAGSLTAELTARFTRREALAVAQIEDVVRVVTAGARRRCPRRTSRRPSTWIPRSWRRWRSSTRGPSGRRARWRASCAGCRAPRWRRRS